jgi:putative protein-disulfide isomerase
MTPILFYCYDAYCGWCFGFSPVMSSIAATYRNRMQFEVLSGGMILPERPTPIGITAGYIQQAYRQVESRTGVKFGTDFLWHIFNPDKSDWFPNSEKPAIALCVFKEFRPDLQLEFATALQRALHVEGRDLVDDESYRHMLAMFAVPELDFYRKLHSEEYRNRAYEEFALVKRLGITGFPTLLLQRDASRLYVVAQGYTQAEQVEEQIEKTLSLSDQATSR